MATSLPGSADSFTTIPAGSRQPDVIGGRTHRMNHNDLGDSLGALTAMVGTGATSSSPTRNKTRIGDGTGTARWDTLGRRNVLINGAMLVAQRAMPTVDNAYCLDRWRLLMESAGSCTVSQETVDVPADGSGFAVKLAATATNNNKFGIFQMIEQRDHHRLRGKTVSLQFKMKVSNTRIGTVKAVVMQAGASADTVTGDPVSAWNAEGVGITPATWAFATNGNGSFTPTTSWATYRVEGVVLSSAMTNLSVLTYSDDKTTTAGDYLVITDVQLEEGAVCTEVDRLPYALELAACKRYYEVFGGTGLFELMGAAACVTTTVATAGARWQVEKRVAPTISFSAVADFCLATAAGQIVTTVLSPSSTSRRDTLVSVTVAAGLTAGQAANFVANNTLNARMTIDAEL